MRTMMVGLLLSAAAAATAWGQTCPAGAADKTASKECCAKTCSTADKTACAASCSETAWAKAGAPTMRIVVGEKTVNCPMEAAELAKKENTAPVYYVGETKYSDMAEAGKAYAGELNKFLETVTTVRYAVGEECVSCPVTAEQLAKKQGKAMKYRLASFDFEARERAEKASAAARKAAESVKLVMKVQDKEFCCEKMAGEAAKKAGCSVEYVVGEQKFECDVQASVMLAVSKVRAALAELEKAAQS